MKNRCSVRRIVTQEHEDLELALFATSAAEKALEECSLWAWR